MNTNTLPGQSKSVGRKLTQRLIWLSLIAALALIGAAALGFLNTLQGVRQNLDATATQAARLFDGFFTSVESDLLATSAVLSVGQSQDKLFRHADSIFKRALERQTGFFELSLVDRHNQVLAQRRRVGGAVQPFSRQPWLSTLETGDVYIGPVDYQEYGVPFVEIAVPVLNEDGGLWAALVAKVDLTVLWNRLVDLRVGETGITCITGEGGQFLIHPNLQLALQEETLPESTGLTPQEILNRGLAFYATLPAGEYTLASALPLSSVPWYAIVQQPLREAFQPFFWQFAVTLAVLLGWALLIVSTARFVSRQVVAPLRALREGVAFWSAGNLDYRIGLRPAGEFGALAETFDRMAAQLQESIATLEKRIAERTRGLQAAAEVSRATTLLIDPEQLLRQTVDVVRERFGLYYVGIFLLDDAQEYAVLRAGTGEAGAHMLAARHQLRAGGDSMIGRCVERGEGRIALDVGAEAVRFDNPWLPDTRSEMALPLRARGRVIGAMTVQSAQEAAFDESDIAIMQTMADQVAIALDNARSFVATQDALREMETVQQRYFGQAWTQFTRQKAVKGYLKTREGFQPLVEEQLSGDVQKALVEQKPVAFARDDAAGLVVPILLRDQPIGALGLTATPEKPRWQAEEIALAELITEQFGLAAENLRLVDETQRRAALDRAVAEITARIRAQVDIESVIEQTLKDLGQTLKAERATVHLSLSGRPQPEEE